jgi:hypothetical protein
MEKVRNLLGIKDGFTTIWTMQDKWLYLAQHDIYIWECTYDVLRAFLPFQTQIHAYQCFVHLQEVLPWLFTNGGFGAHPYLISQVLLLVTALQWERHLGGSLSQTALVITFGLVCFLLFSIRKSYFLLP